MLSNYVDTKPYTPQDFRFTQKGSVLYAIEMAWPTDEQMLPRKK